MDNVKQPIIDMINVKHGTLFARMTSNNNKIVRKRLRKSGDDSVGGLIKSVKGGGLECVSEAGTEKGEALLELGFESDESSAPLVN